jgi:hypothetical protein
MRELNPTVCGEAVKSLLSSPQASKGLVKLLLSISAVQAMSGATKPGDPDSFIDAAAMVVELRKAYADFQKKKGAE